MKTEKTFTEDHQVKITAEFEPELLDQFKHKAARKIARRTHIPGFRPGKAPYATVLNHVGELEITQEAIDLMVEEVYPQVIEAEGIKPWGPGSLDAIKSENPPVFEFTIPLEPTAELNDVDSLRKEYKLPEVSDEDVEKFILRARRSYATLVPVETPATEDTVVYMNLEGRDKNSAEGEDAVVIPAAPYQALITSPEEEQESEWPYKGFAREFIGRKAGETFEIIHEYPADDLQENLAGKTVVLSGTIETVKALELPELDEDFLGKIGGFASLEEMKDYFRAQLSRESLQEYEDDYFNDLMEQIRAKAVIKYPPQMLEEEIQYVKNSLEHELSHQQMTLDLYLKLRQTDEETFMKNEVEPVAKKRLEKSLIVDELTKKYNVQITDKMVEDAASQYISALLESGELEEVQKTLGTKKFAEYVSNQAIRMVVDSEVHRVLRSIASPESIQAEAPEALPSEDSPAVAAIEPTPEAAAEAPDTESE